MPAARTERFKQILITGGAGYVGAVLVPKLLEKGYRVRVLDLFIFGKNIWNGWKDHPQLEEIQGDLRDESLVRKSLQGTDAVIHLACISNDPSFELDPTLGQSINYDAFAPLVRMSKEAGVRRFIYASSSSVYGVSEAKDVTEDHPLIPLTDYSKYKALCEPLLLKEQSDSFTPVVLRPATVCGYSPRLRLDLTVNILTAHAVVERRIKVFGGSQMRPNIHIDDVTDLYLKFLEWPNELVAGKTYNAGYENFTVAELAERVRRVVDRQMPAPKPIEIITTPADDIRSYHISSEKIKKELGFIPRKSIEDAVGDLVKAFQAGKIPNPMTDGSYYNLKTLREWLLKQPSLR